MFFNILYDILFCAKLCKRGSSANLEICVWRCWFVVVELGTAAINVVAVLLLLLVVQQQQQQHR